MTLNDDPRGGERDPALDRLYRAGADEAPPARLDAAILAAARREVGARPRPLSTGLRRWRVPVSIAAVVVLSVSVVTLVREEGGDVLIHSSPESSLPRAPVARPAPPASVPAPTAEGERMRSRPAPTTPSRSAPREDGNAGTVGAGGEAADSAAGLAGDSGRAAEQGPAKVVAPEPAAKPRPEAFRDSTALSGRSASAPAAPAMRSSTQQAAPAAEMAGASALGQARKEAASAEDRSPAWQGYEKEPPQKWLDRIEELRRQQRTADADAMLAEFKRRFPGHPLPAGLQ